MANVQEISSIFTASIFLCFVHYKVLRRQQFSRSQEYFVSYRSTNPDFSSSDVSSINYTNVELFLESLRGLVVEKNAKVSLNF